MLSLLRAQVQSLVRELRSLMGMARRKKEKVMSPLFSSQDKV